MLNDINFALTHIDSNTIYHNTRRENNNKLVLDNLPKGTYELLVYSHQCLTNMESGYLNNIVGKY